ncbi:MAG: DUF1552 domain-containing protein [Pirellulaceae bacterium]|nr:DUF1552 domain-containing protein [Pirellulaceae bacterium]
MFLSRRDVLKGFSVGAGSLVLAPVLRQIEAQAAASAKSPLRFVFVVEGNGLPWQQVTPATIKRGKQDRERQKQVIPLADHELPSALKPINAWKDRLTVVTGLSGRVCGGGHSNNFGALGVYNCDGGVGNSGAAKAETIDVALGKHLGGIFPHVGLGMIEQEQSVVYNCSAWDKGKPMPTTCHPEVAYASLFGSVAGGSAKQEFLARTNVLDFLLDDIRRLEKLVAGPEREKLEAHIASYEAMRDRQSRLNEIENTLREKAPVVGDKYKSAVETDRLDAQFDIAAAALIGGLTNSVTLASGVGDPYFGVKFTGLGINFGKHGIGHGGNYNGMTWDVMSTKIRGFHFELIARMMTKLQAVPEGSGTMLDNTVIVYLSDAAEGHHSRCWEWPMVVLGTAGGRLQGGQYVEYPYWGLPGHREMGNLYATLLHLAGDQRDYFGVRDPMLKGDARGDGPLPELLA